MRFARPIISAQTSAGVADVGVVERRLERRGLDELDLGPDLRAGRGGRRGRGASSHAVSQGDWRTHRTGASEGRRATSVIRCGPGARPNSRIAWSCVGSGSSSSVVGSITAHPRGGSGPARGAIGVQGGARVRTGTFEIRQSAARCRLPDDPLSTPRARCPPATTKARRRQGSRTSRCSEAPHCDAARRGSMERNT